ncbi:unnamed protein product [Amoebophrya sp. A120]|nr:unnamed protein product [Amoebophrya sp. A120]|eukprot:GSA120T00025731001.1
MKSMVKAMKKLAVSSSGSSRSMKSTAKKSAPAAAASSTSSSAAANKMKAKMKKNKEPESEEQEEEKKEEVENNGRPRNSLVTIPNEGTLEELKDLKQKLRGQKKSWENSKKVPYTQEARDAHDEQWKIMEDAFAMANSSGDNTYKLKLDNETQLIPASPFFTPRGQDGPNEQVAASTRNRKKTNKHSDATSAIEEEEKTKMASWLERNYPLTTQLLLMASVSLITSTVSVYLAVTTGTVPVVE